MTVLTTGRYGFFFFFSRRFVVCRFCTSSIGLRTRVNSLPAIDAHERQLFDKLLWGLVTSTIFVRC
jgi:hypothetical protein